MRNNPPGTVNDSKITVVAKETAFSGALFVSAKDIFNRPKGIFLSMPEHFQFRRQRELFSGFCHFCRFVGTALKYSELKSIAPEISHQNWIFLKDINASLRGCLHDTCTSFILVRVHPGSYLSLCICLHDTGEKSHTSTTHTGMSSSR